MKSFTLVFLAVILVGGFTGQSTAGPRPMAFSGDFQDGGVIHVFGQGFGPLPRIENGVRPAFGLIAGDNQDFDQCTVRREMVLLTWSDQQIKAALDLAGLDSGSDFYFFVIDATGQVSWPAGPWNLAGPVPRPGKTVALLESDKQLTPLLRRRGYPYLANWGPSAPGAGRPILSLYGDRFGDHPGLGDQPVGYLTAEELSPGLVMGDGPTLEECTWFFGVDLQWWAEDHVFFPLVVPDRLQASTVFFYLVTAELKISNGFPLVLSEADRKKYSPASRDQDASQGESSGVWLERFFSGP
jgi:hypothetical protein